MILSQMILSHQEAEGNGDASVHGLVVHAKHPAVEAVESDVREDGFQCPASDPLLIPRRLRLAAKGWQSQVPHQISRHLRLGQRRATQSLPNVLQETDGAERSSLGLIQSQPIQCALRGEPAFRKRLMQKKSRVEQIAQFGDIFRTAVLDPLPGFILVPVDCVWTTM
jgi:hypothetical protein